MCAIIVATATIQGEDCLASLNECILPIQPYINDTMSSWASLQLNDTICPYVNHATLLTTAVLCSLAAITFNSQQLAE